MHGRPYSGLAPTRRPRTFSADWDAGPGASGLEPLPLVPRTVRPLAVVRRRWPPQRYGRPLALAQVGSPLPHLPAAPATNRRRALSPSSAHPRPAGDHAHRPTAARFAAFAVCAVRTRTERQLWETWVARYHSLGFKRTVGQNLLYWVCDRRGRPLAGWLWGAAAWQCAPRDRFIGWDAALRARGLSALVNHRRFVVWPWVRVPQLASHVLACVVRRLPADGQARYGQPVPWLETFVDPTRFAGTVSRSANWLGVGRTQGRGRQGPRRATPGVPPKDVSLDPLPPQFRQRLLPGP